MLLELKSQIEANTGHTFNSLLCNLYRDEKDSVDWHSDDEPALGSCPVIASLSLGATRTFEMRKKPAPVSGVWGPLAHMHFLPVALHRVQAGAELLGLMISALGPSQKRDFVSGAKRGAHLAVLKAYSSL